MSDLKRVLLIGIGKGGSLLLRTLHEMENVQIIGVVDVSKEAPGIVLAQMWGIPFSTSSDTFMPDDQGVFPDIVIEATGSLAFYEQLRYKLPTHVTLVSGSVASWIMNLIHQLSVQRHELKVILNSTHDAMIAVDRDGLITLFNAAAERLTGRNAKDVIGTWVGDSIPNSRLQHVLVTGEPELNQLQGLDSTQIITNRVPIRNDDGEITGAVAVFRDITEVQVLVEEVTNLKQIQQMLAAIINSTQDAISVVDSEGRGILINPAYTRLTGLTESDVIGKPATVDIAEGESMHLQVLKTRKPVRGVRMKVGPNRRDVIVNAAPMIVDNELKGSVGVVHDVSDIQNLTEQLDQAKQLIRKLEAKYTFDDIIGSSAEMQTALEQGRIAASTHATVLLRGESGTGKELFAHAIHNASERRYNQFVRVNCAAISASLLESELFGYVEGAFTGAVRGGKKGLFEEASGGTIFLDEIGELSTSIQAKLLRVLQEKEIVRVGSTKSIPVNVRVISATHVNLEEAIKKGTFREDLYYRLNVLPIFIPPLRARTGDIKGIAERLIRKFNQEYGRSVEHLSSEALEALGSYRWPGNVRELENVLGRSIINMSFADKWIELRHLPVLENTPSPSIDTKSKIDSTLQQSQPRPLADVIHEIEESYIKKVLESTGGNKTETACLLGISTRNLYYKLERYGLQ